MIASDLIDQINPIVFPVILETGKRALEKSEGRKLRLKESKVVVVVVLIYARAA